MPIWTDFVGGSYRAIGRIIAADQAINVFTETRDVPGGGKQSTLYGTPGRKLLTTASTTVGRGWWNQDGRLFVTIGTGFYELTIATLTLTLRGTLSSDGSRVFYASNGQGGNQLGILSVGSLYVLNLATNVFSGPIALPFSDPTQLAFIDGYTLVLQGNSPIVWFSGIEDMTSWDALDFFARSETSDNFVGITVTRDRVWGFGTKTTTLFYDSGDVDTPFLPYPGTTIQIGLLNVNALWVYQDTVLWLGISANGQARVVKATDTSSITPVSTAAIDFFLSRCAALSDVEFDFYEQESHPFLVMTAPSSPDDVQTYVADLREPQTPWHARADLNMVTGAYQRWGVRGMVSTTTQVLATDATTGNIYQIDLATYTNNGDILKRERTAPYLSNDNQWIFIDQFELGIQAGMGLTAGQGVAPVAELSVSTDGAQTFTSAGFGTLGAEGNYQTRCLWTRLGRARTDRLVFRVTQTDPVQTVWGPGVWIRASQGSGQI